MTAAADSARTKERRQSGTSAALSPAESLSRAKTLCEQANRKSRAGDAGGAFQDAAAAWSLVNRYPDDPQCRSLRDQIAGQFDDLAAKANQGRTGRSDLDEKTLIVE